MADDVDIDFDKMSLWSKEEAEKFFESGGVDEPSSAAATPPKAALLPKPDDADMKKWFPKWVKQDNPKFRIVCFHNAGSSESTYTGKGLRQKEDNPFVTHCKQNGGELLACELPGRETRRNEPRERVLRPCCEALYPVLAPLLQEESVPYVVVGHSMGTWMSYEFIRLLAERGIPLPRLWVVSGFPAPSIAEKERPWNRNEPMDDAAFMEEARGWNVNEVVFQPANWKVFSGMMRDDFTLFDSYVYTPPPAHVAKGEFPLPIKAKYAEMDGRCKKHHLEGWRAFTSEKLKFTVEQTPGNHLFFYDVPARAAWMHSVLKDLPDGFGASAVVSVS